MQVVRECLAILAAGAHGALPATAAGTETGAGTAQVTQTAPPVPASAAAAAGTSNAASNGAGSSGSAGAAPAAAQPVSREQLQIDALVKLCDILELEEQRFRYSFGSSYSSSRMIYL